MASKEVHRLIDGLLESPIAFHRIFATISGSATAGLMLSQMWYWTKNSKAQERKGWFYKTRQEWEKETALTRTEQETARRYLRDRGLIEEDKRGVPCKLYYRVNIEAVYNAIIDATKNEQEPNEIKLENDELLEIPSVCGKPANWNAGKPQTSLRESRNPVSGKPADKFAGKPQTFTTETTQETIPETYQKTTRKGESRTASQAAAPIDRQAENDFLEPIALALMNTCDMKPELLTKKNREEVERLKKGYWKLHKGQESPEEIADEIQRFRSWWVTENWKGQKGEAPTLSDIGLLWGSYKKACRECPERYWEM